MSGFVVVFGGFVAVSLRLRGGFDGFVDLRFVGAHSDGAGAKETVTEGPKGTTESNAFPGTLGGYCAGSPRRARRDLRAEPRAPNTMLICPPARHKLRTRRSPRPTLFPKSGAFGFLEKRK